MRDTSNTVVPSISQVIHGFSDAPWQYDYFSVMRRLEASASNMPRWGLALLPSAESVRVGQEPSMIFAPAGISKIEGANDRSPPKIRQRFFGYIGPNGPLPSHLSEFIQERALNYADPTWLAFLDGFTHRFALHFYRAWAQARPAVALDRPAEDCFKNQVGALIGVGTNARQNRDEINDDARLHFSGHLIRQIRSTESLQSVLQAYFSATVAVEQWAGRWMTLPHTETSRLGLGQVSRSLGRGAVLGTAIWDRQHYIRVCIGPLTLAQHKTFLPNGTAPPVLRAWMRQLLGDEFDWEAQLVLCSNEVPHSRLGAQLGNSPRLGWTSWIGLQPRKHNATDVRLASSTHSKS